MSMTLDQLIGKLIEISDGMDHIADDSPAVVKVENFPPISVTGVTVEHHEDMDGYTVWINGEEM